MQFAAGATRSKRQEPILFSMTGFPSIALVSILIGLAPAGCKPTPAAKPEQAATEHPPSPEGGTAASTPAAVKDNPRSPRNSLIDAIESELLKIKPDIETTTLVSLLPVQHSDSKWYMALAVGRGPHRGWKQIQDVGEVFAVFWVDKTLTRISPPLDLFPTRRLLDYDVALTKIGDGAVILCARGAMYGDAYMKRSIPIEAGLFPLERVWADTNIYERGKVDPVCGSTGPSDDIP